MPNLENIPILPVSIVPTENHVELFKAGHPVVGAMVVVQNVLTGVQELYEVTKGFGGSKRRVFEAGGLGFYRNGHCAGKLRYLRARPATEQDCQVLAKSRADAKRLRQQRVQNLLGAMLEPAEQLLEYIQNLPADSETFAGGNLGKIKTLTRRISAAARKAGLEWPHPVD